MASLPVLSFENGLQHPIYVYSKAQLREQMELSPHMALLHDRHFQDILPHVDGEAVVPFRDAHLAVVRPEDVRVDPVELGVGEYDTAFKCQVWGSYDCVVKIPNNNVLKDWHPTSTRLKQRGAAEYVPLLSVATYSITPAFCWGFETEFRVAKRLFEPFWSTHHRGGTPHGSRVQPYAGAPRFSTCSQDSACGAGGRKAAHVVFRAL